MHELRTRRSASRKLRREAAELAFLRDYPNHPTSAHEQRVSNGEEQRYRDANGLSFIANYHKGLPHPDPVIAEVDRAAYRLMLQALASGEREDFEKIPYGAAVAQSRRFTNPRAGLAFDLEGPDSHSLRIPPPPRIDEPQTAGEMAELYWMALLRDVRFEDYAGDALAQAAAASLNTFPAFTGPKTVANLFRGNLAGDQVGPYISQFLLLNVPYGPFVFRQRRRTAALGSDFMTQFPIFVDIQNGEQPGIPLPTVAGPFFIRNLRDMAFAVRTDVSYQYYLFAALILSQLFPPPNPNNAPPCMSGPLDLGNAYFPPGAPPPREEGFGTFGNWHLPSLLAEVATRALKAAWFQKWYVHRRLRPEALGGLIDVTLGPNPSNYPIHSSLLDTLRNQNIPNIPGVPLASLARHFGPAGPNKPAGTEFPDSFLLPQAFPEGSPMHPSLPQGHATVGAACATILKAWFDESFIIPNPQVVNAQGGGLMNAPGNPQLTVGGELNKLVSNISLGGRGGAGVHSRSDYVASLGLGEAVAIGILEEQQRTYAEEYSFSLTKFDGETITIGSRYW